ncbi:hypothetical protein ACFLWX_02720 [Chloroflexota bacterium]
MLIETSKVSQFLESIGCTRKMSAPYTFIEYSTPDNKVIILDDEFQWTDTNFLVEDVQQCGAHEIALKIKAWIKKQEEEQVSD